MEGALKLKEVSYIHAEGYPAGEMKHGPIALIDRDMPVFALCPRDGLREKMMSNIEQVKDARGHGDRGGDGRRPGAGGEGGGRDLRAGDCRRC